MKLSKEARQFPQPTLETVVRPSKPVVTPPPSPWQELRVRKNGPMLAGDSPVWNLPSSCAMQSEFSCYGTGPTSTCPLTIGGYGCDGRSLTSISASECAPPGASITGGLTYIWGSTACPGEWTAASIATDLNPMSRFSIAEGIGKLPGTSTWALCCMSGFTATSQVTDPYQTGGLYCASVVQPDTTAEGFPADSVAAVCRGSRMPASQIIAASELQEVQVFAPSVYIGWSDSETGSFSLPITDGPGPTHISPIPKPAVSSTTQPVPAQHSSALSGGAKAGIAIAIIGAVIILPLIILCLYRRRKHRKQIAESFQIQGRDNPHAFPPPPPSMTMRGPGSTRTKTLNHLPPIRTQETPLQLALPSPGSLSMLSQGKDVRPLTIIDEAASSDEEVAPALPAFQTSPYLQNPSHDMWNASFSSVSLATSANGTPANDAPAKIQTAAVAQRVELSEMTVVRFEESRRSYRRSGILPSPTMSDVE